MQPEATALARTVPTTRDAPRSPCSRPPAALAARAAGRVPAAWASRCAGNARSPKFLLRTLAVVPAAAWFAVEMERLGVGHVHAHYATHPALAAWVCHRLTGIPYSFTAHAHDLYVERPMLARKARDAAFVVTISEFNRRLLGELLAPARSPHGSTSCAAASTSSASRRAPRAPRGAPRRVRRQP